MSRLPLTINRNAMSDVLDKIITKSAKRFMRWHRATALPIWVSRASATAPRGFTQALKSASQTGYGLIAELKKASPSKGLIRAEFDPPSLASATDRRGKLSVGTHDTPWFQGDDLYLAQARNAVSIPVLRKDFMIDPLQIVQSRALGADCIR